MRHFRRVLRYVAAQYNALVLSVICALLTALLFSMSVAMLLPLMKVMIGEEGLHGWVNRMIVKDRCGIGFAAERLRESWAPAHLREAAAPPLRIEVIERDSSAHGTGLLPEDVILEAVLGQADGNIPLDPNEMLAGLAHAAEHTPVTLMVRRGSDPDQQHQVNFVLSDVPWYTPAARWLLGFVPSNEQFDSAEQLGKFKRDCIIKVIVLMLVATLLRCLLRFFQQYLVKRIGFFSIMQMRQDAYRSAIRLPLSHFSSEGSSDTTSRFIRDANQTLVGINTLLGKAVRDSFKIICLVATAMVLNSQMTLILLASAPIAVWLFGKLGQKMKRATRRTLQSWSRMLARLQDTLLGMRVVKGYHREQYEEQQFLQVNRKLLKQQLRMGKIDAAGGPLLESLGMTAACVAMCFAMHLLTAGNMTTSTFFTLVLMLAMIAESGRKLGNVYPRLQAANAAAERVFELIDAPVEHDPPGAVTAAPLREQLEIRALTFAYPGATSPALQDINLTVKAGETIALVGPNGSGKTTLLSMIPRFFGPDKGAILLDGQDIAQVTLASLRCQIGIVTQRTIVFNDTIAANIAYGDLRAGEAEVIAASQRAYAHEFIEQTPDGYQTIIGEQGATLSGGQLQRLAIARAILRNPAILIFDEAMSQIDSDSEAKIQQALADFAANRTSFIIAHRLSTVINADRIVVLNAGRIIAQGDHKTLLQTCPLYRQLYEVQFGNTAADQ